MPLAKTPGKSANVLGRILGLLLLIVLLSLVGFLWLDILGLVDARQVALPLLKMVGFTSTERQINAEDPLLLDRERLIKREDSLSILQEELGLQTADLKKQNDEVLQKQNSLTEQQKALEDQQNSFNEALKAADDKKANLVQNSKYLNSMPPVTAVQILLKMEDQDLIDLFRVTEELAKANGTNSIVSAWLSKFPPERAAAIQRKMARKTGS
jgi:flagellar protein FlbB